MLEISALIYIMCVYLIGGYAMAYTINDDCTNCGVCEPECPVECISEKENVRWIDPDSCTDCGACQEVCPVEAISAE